MREITLRQYQTDAVEALREGVRSGHRSQVLCAPTGAGKTLVAAHLMNEARKKGTKVAFVVDRVSLVDQTSAVLDSYGIPHGVVQSDHWRRQHWEPIQICSAQTLEKRGFFPDLKMLVVDEAHCMRKATGALIQSKPDLLVFGLTATPFAKGMAELYSRVVNVTTTNRLIEDKFLVPIRAYAAKAVDMRGAKVVAGEWTDSEIEERGREIVGDIVNEWIDKTKKHFGGPAKTIVFAASVGHGEELCRQFNDAGYNFQQISYLDTNDERRRELIEEFRKKDSAIDGLVACEILTKGFDVPDVMVGISARPYRKSLSSHVQQLGRVMRPCKGKEFALWLCMARGSRVLTDRGLVPIEQVSLSDKVWDGTDFVSHGGAVCNGTQPVITYQGLTATPGHLVHTAQGWRTFGDCAREQVAITQAGLGEQAIRVCEDHFTGRAVVGREVSALHSCGVRVRESSRPLRTGEHPVANCGAQPTEQARQSSGGAYAQIPAGFPGRSLFGQHAQAAVVERTDGCGDRGEVAPTLIEAEREVWDILDAGPLNRFTCEGLLVHNCHSGNYLRFRQDVEDLFSNGVSELEAKSRDAEARKEPTEKERAEIRCVCGYVLPPSARVCPACGKERERRAMIQTVSGVMVAVNHDGKPLPDALQNRAAVWRQIIGYAQMSKPKDPVAARKFALAQFRAIYGRFPAEEYRPDIADVPTLAVANKIKSNLIRYANRRHGGRA